MQASSRAWLAAVLVLAVAAPLLLVFHARHPLLYDTDSFYHLAVAREVAHHGVLHELPWLRLSALGAGFGDKELLFHWLLAPFAAAGDPLAGGRAALATFEAALLAALTALAWRAVGPWGLVVVPWLLLGSLELDWRLVRLRPELLSLLLLLAALAAAGSGRYRLLGALAAGYALAYTGFHALLAICWALFAWRGVTRRRWEWPLLLYPLLGTLVGVMAHPSFPHNLVVWKLQNVDHFRLAGAYARTQEMAADSTDVLLLANVGWWLGALVLWLARDRQRAAMADERAAALAARTEAFAIATVAFGLLYLLSSRFAVYFFPFASIWLLLEIARRGGVAHRLTLPGGRQLPTIAALLLVALVAAPLAARELDRFATRTALGPGRLRLADREAMSRALPAGATVAAPWTDTPIYMLWAAQGRYLNALDPVFMAAVDPAAWAAEQAIFAGDEPDVPLRTASTLESGWIAWSTPSGSRRLLDRLRGDPRARPLHAGIQALFALRPAPPGAFQLDWSVAGVPYPRLPRRDLRALEGYVDARRVASRGCVAMESRTLAGGAYELATSGPTRLWSGASGPGPLIATGGNGAVLGDGVTFELPPGPARVLTCPDAAGRNGFYLLRRDRL